MKKSIYLSAMVIVLVLAFTAVATFAYFSATKDESCNSNDSYDWHWWDWWVSTIFHQFVTGRKSITII